MSTEKTNTVSFFTCCYKADWEFFLKEGRLKEMIDRCHYDFDSRNLVINNVIDREEVKRYADKAVTDGVIDQYFFSDEYIGGALRHFHLKRKYFRLDGYDGYWYSVAPLTAAFVCTTSYLLFFTGDCMMQEKYDGAWIQEGIGQLQDEKIFCVTPLWAYFDKKVEKNFKEGVNCFYDQGFSDQCFLARSRDLRGDIYNEYHVLSEVFPIYGGNHFERRVFCYINNRKLLRCVFRNVVYEHDKLVKPGFFQEKKFSLIEEAKYFIAKTKRAFRRRNILVKFLLR
jgi:hypothetical protein